METSSVLQMLAASVAVLLIVSAPTGCDALLVKALRVPAWAQLHHSAELSCQYDTQGAKLYSVKWYKDQREFYRYLIDSDPKIRIFAMEGVDVDVSQSNDTILHLANVSFQTAGHYMCEVSLDAPTFLTAMTSAILNVVSLPKEGPRITGLEDWYEPGASLVANCTIGSAVPRATLRWYLNEEQVDSSHLIQPPGTHRPPHMGDPTWLALNVTVDAAMFSKRRNVELRCQSFVADLPYRAHRVVASLRDLRVPGNQRLHSGSGPSASALPCQGVLLLVVLLPGIQLLMP